MRAVMVQFFSPEADHSLRSPLAPPARSRLEGLFRANRGQGDMKVDACDAACSMDHKISRTKANRRVPIHLYNRSTWRLRLD
jgi:hypothetical protein